MAVDRRELSRHTRLTFLKFYPPLRREKCLERYEKVENQSLMSLGQSRDDGCSPLARCRASRVPGLPGPMGVPLGGKVTNTRTDELEPGNNILQPLFVIRKPISHFE